MYIVMVIILCAFPLVATAYDCSSLSQNKLNGTLRTKVDAEPLTINQRKMVVSFLKRLYKKREGKAFGYVCKKSKVKVSSNEARLGKKSNNKDSYSLVASFEIEGNHGIGTEVVSYSVSKDKLYSGLNETGYEVVINKLSNNEVILHEKNRFNGTMIKEVIRHYKFGRKLIVNNTYFVNGLHRGEVKWVFK